MLKWLPCVFFKVFVLVEQCFDVNPFDMKLNVDNNMDGTEAGLMRHLKIF